MTANRFRRIALALPQAVEGEHQGHADFRVGKRIFATLAAAKLGYGNIMITPEQQYAFVEELPSVFIPVPGGWGRGGATHINLAAANEDVVLGALQTAHKLRVEKNAETGTKPSGAKTKSKTKPTQKTRPVRKPKSTKPKPNHSKPRSNK